MPDENRTVESNVLITVASKSALYNGNLRLIPDNVVEIIEDEAIGEIFTVHVKPGTLTESF